jgi:hypothetical protein
MILSRQRCAIVLSLLQRAAVDAVRADCINRGDDALGRVYSPVPFVPPRDNGRSRRGWRSARRRHEKLERLADDLIEFVRTLRRDISTS